jgi:hypothetical protein
MEHGWGDGVNLGEFDVDGALVENRACWKHGII